MNIFKEMALSVYSYGSYKQFLQNKKGKVFGFGALLVAIYFTITILIPSLIAVVSPSGVIHSFVDSIPDFELQDGELWVEDVIEYEESGTYIYIDTDPEYVFYDADEIAPDLREYTTVLLMDSEKMIIKSNGEVQGFYFSELGGDFDKQDLSGLIPYMYIFYVAAMIFVYVWMAALFFFGVVFVALMGMAVASAANYRLTYGQLYLLGIYSRTLSLIIKAVVNFLPIRIPFFWAIAINFGLSVLILYLAIRKMKEEQPQQQYMGYGNPSDPYMNNWNGMGGTYGTNGMNGTNSMGGMNGMGGTYGANNMNGMGGTYGTNNMNGMGGMNGTNNMNGMGGMYGTNDMNSTNGMNDGNDTNSFDDTNGR